MPAGEENAPGLLCLGHQDLGLAQNDGTEVDSWRVAPDVTEAILAEGIRAARPND